MAGICIADTEQMKKYIFILEIQKLAWLSMSLIALYEVPVETCV